MGEANRKREREKNAQKQTIPMSQARFNLYTMGTRSPLLSQISQEISWWSSRDEKLIGAVAFESVDEQYFWTILARDRIRRFRCVKTVTSFEDQLHTEIKLRTAMAEALDSEEINQIGEQGDEPDHSINLFHLPADHDVKKIHPYFHALLNDPGKAPARAVLRELAAWLAPTDPHLVTEFQTNGFDQRLWEFYLWATFREFSLDVKQMEAPDFHCRGPGADFTVEATTVGPSKSGVLQDHPNPETPEDLEEFSRNYMPIKFGSALTAKLDKKDANDRHYWEKEESMRKPFLIAIADFHKPAEPGKLGSITYTGSALWQYLYGRHVSWKLVDERLIINYKRVEKHNFKGKQIPSAFFDLPNAENVSAVLFSNAGTISKFGRMGTVAGFGAKGYECIRVGLKYNPDPNSPIGDRFRQDVRDKHYKERWAQEIQVFHNPNAKYPLPVGSLLGATHHYFEDNRLQSIVPKDAVITSVTLNLGKE